jgi:hypothetical protein
MRYQVKFFHEGKTIYGVVDSYSDDAKKYAKEGKVLVSDAISPRSYVVLDSQLTDIGIEDREYNDHLLAEFIRAKAVSASNPDDGVLRVGDFFGVPVADGKAWYVVTKVNKTTCMVEWRGFCADRWTDHHFGWGGRFSVASVLRYTTRQKGMMKLFGG